MNNDTLCHALLQAVSERPVVADTLEEGLDALAHRLPAGISRTAVSEAVQRAVAAGLVYDPVRLPPGALQCHWHLELTPRGRQTLLQAGT